MGAHFFFSGSPLGFAKKTLGRYLLLERSFGRQKEEDVIHCSVVHILDCV